MCRRNIALTTLFLCLVLSFRVQAQTLVQGQPPLTRVMVDRVVDFFEWSLGVRLTEAQKGQVQQKLTAAWKANDRSEIEGTQKILDLYMQLQSLSNEDLARARPDIRDGLVKLLREDKNDEVARMLVSLYDSKSNTAAAQPKQAATTPSAPVKIGPGDIFGIYIATTKQLIAPGPGSPVQYGLTWTPGRDWITFLPGGRVFARLPEEGLENFDYDAAVRKNPEARGTYVVSGNVVRVTWPSGGGKIFKRTADGELWEDRTNYTPLPKATGLKLDGIYAVQWNEQSRQRVIGFTPDGRFEERGFLDMINWHPRDIDHGSGTYRISNNTLELRYTDGRVLQINFYVFPEELNKPRPSVIYINSFDFTPLR
jgi:hypothetical protein